MCPACCQLLLAMSLSLCDCLILSYQTAFQMLPYRLGQHTMVRLHSSQWLQVHHCFRVWSPDQGYNLWYKTGASQRTLVTFLFRGLIMGMILPTVAMAVPSLNDFGRKCHQCLCVHCALFNGGFASILPTLVTSWRFFVLFLLLVPDFCLQGWNSTDQFRF